MAKRTKKERYVVEPHIEKLVDEGVTIKEIWLVIALLVTCAGCTTVRPLAEYTHLSIATQHVDGSNNNYGCNMIGAGIRWRPHRKVQVDLLESYSKEVCLGDYREVFTGRVTVEF